MLQFAQLLWFLMLPLPWLVTRFWPEYRERLRTVRVPFLELLARLTGQAMDTRPQAAVSSRGQQLVSWLVWLLILTALARPQWLEEPLTRTLPARDLLLAVDLSGSMETEDMKDADGKPILLKDIWPSAHEVQTVIAENVTREMFQSSFSSVFEGDER